jgi:pantothenate kinase-related protein Tda10
VLKREVREGALLHQHQILQNDFLWAFIEAKQLMVLNQMKDIKLTVFRGLYLQKAEKKIEPAVQSARPALAVITGTYTTGKYRIAQTLARFGRKETTYHVFHVSYENLFARMEVSTYIDMLDEFIRDAPAAANRLFLVVVPSWLNAA